jgi:hypothetical protein
MSIQSMLQFAEEMLAKSAFLQEHCHDLEQHRDPGEETPIGMMGDFGLEIASGYETMTPAERTLILGLIEQGLLSHDEDVSTAVATGLIEGLIHRAEVIDGRWEKIEPDLGPEARAYADAYRNADFFQGTRQE